VHIVSSISQVNSTHMLSDKLVKYCVATRASELSCAAAPLKQTREDVCTK
jgi:hypothetical protein